MALRLALKAFADQKRRFFPHLEDDSCVEVFGAVKKQCISQASALNQRDELSEDRTLSDVLICVEKEAPNKKILTYQRLDWLKRASLLSSPNENGLDLFKEQSFHSSNRLRRGSLCVMAADQIAAVELLVPLVFRAIISLHPFGSISPYAVAFFYPDEEHANKALQYLMGVKPEVPLHLLLQLISSYQTLFTKVRSKCDRLLTMDRPSALLLPPVHRSYRQILATRTPLVHSSLPLKDQSSDGSTAYHIGCSSDEA